VKVRFPPPGVSARPFATPAEVVERALRVPSSLRAFGVDAEKALRVCGVDASLLEELLDLGLPSRGAGARRTFDGIDLANVAVHLGLPSLQHHVMDGWGRTLATVSRGPSARYVLEYRARCERCLPRTSGSYRFLVPPGRHVTTQGGRPHRVPVERPTSWPPFPAPAADVSAHMERYWFWGLPAPINLDIGFVRANRLAGCRMAAPLVEEECTARGLDVRVRYGLMLVVPFAGAHLWNELRVDETWVAFDPFLMQILHRHTGLDPRTWPATRSPGAILASLGTGRVLPITIHNGHESRPSITTKLVADGEPAPIGDKAT
jgi:hypothetical protein